MSEARTMQRLVRIIFLFLFYSLANITLAQDVIVKGAFLQDSARLGDRLDYYLVARYPSELTVLFPDSTFQFDPFEFASKRYFQTQTQEGQSYDSVLYQFFTFDISDVQYLSLPVFSVGKSDSVTFTPLRDSVILISLIGGPVPDSVSAQELPLKTNTVYQRVSYLLNYPLFLISMGILMVAVLLIWIFFGKRIRKYFRIKKLYKNHKKFSTSFNELIIELKAQFEVKKTEYAVSLWKKYLEQLEHKPYTKLTTRETIALEKDEILGKSLQLLDRAIYGSNTLISTPLENLQQIADTRFLKILEEVKHG